MSNLTVKDYWQFDTAKKINLYYPPFIIVIGCVGNLLSFLIYVKKRNRVKIAAVYILSLAVIDTITLLSCLLQYWIMFNYLPEKHTALQCRVMFYIVNALGNSSHWTIVAFTVDRFIAVWFPYWTKTHQTTRRGWIIVTSICIVAFVKNLHYIWTADFAYQSDIDTAVCSFGIASEDAWKTKYQTFELVISSLVPFSLIIVLNTAIIYKWRKYRRLVKEPSDSPVNFSKASKENLEKTRKKKLFDYGLTISLLLVSTVFVILVTPVMGLRLIYANKSKPLSSYDKAVYEMYYQLFHKLWYTNNAVNFFLYSMSCKIFRKDLKELFESCLKKRKIFYSNSIHMISQSHEQQRPQQQRQQTNSILNSVPYN